MDIKNDIMYMTNSITDRIKINISNEVKKLLQTIFIQNENQLSLFEINSYTKDLYKLIIYFSNSNRNASIKIMGGFIQFGKSNTGKQYRPMIDYFMMEIVDILLNQCGWSIIKPVLNMLRENIQKFQKDSTFKYISNKIMKQLEADRLNIEALQPISNLCYYMPREKSFTFGWYSYYIACELYGNKNYYNETLKKTHIRHYLMIYRKFINELCRNVVIMQTDTVPDESLHIDLKYSDLQTEFNKPLYKRVDEIIETVLPVEEEHVEEEHVEEKHADVEEKHVEEEHTKISLTPPKEEEVIIKNENVNEKKWFSGWFSGWI